MAKSLGVAPVDLNNDGWIDFVVANDQVQNFVLSNRHNGTFVEVGAQSGVAFDPYGLARGAMGIDSARFRNDNALSRGQAVGFDDDRKRAIFQTLVSLFRGSTFPESGSRNPVRLQESLRERLAGLKSRVCSIRADYLETVLSEKINDTEAERNFGADKSQVHPLLLGKVQQVPVFLGGNRHQLRL